MAGPARRLHETFALAEWFPRASTRVRLLLAFPLVDQLYITAVTSFEHSALDERDRRRFYCGAAAHLAAAWVAAQTVGVVVGDRLPDGVGLHAASLLALAGLLASSLPSRPARVAVVVAAATTVIGVHLPYHSVIRVAILAGMTAGASRRLS